MAYDNSLWQGGRRGGHAAMASRLIESGGVHAGCRSRGVARLRTARQQANVKKS